MSFSTPSRRRAVRAAVPVVGILAAGLLVWQGSNAAFTATTTAGTNTWTAGTVSLENNSGGTFLANAAAAFTVSDIKPGDTGEACIVVRSQGTVPGAGRFFVSNVTGTAGSGGSSIQSQINLTVEAGTGTAADCTDFTSTQSVLSGVALTAAPTNFAGATNSWTLAGTAGETRTYRIAYQFNPAAGNAYQGGSAEADFNWEVQ